MRAAALSALLLGCVVALGCAREVSRGQVVDYQTSVGIYFAAEGDKYHPLDEKQASLLLTDAVWLLPKGIELVQKTAEVEKGTVGWSDGGSRYSCDGALVSFRITAKVKPDCPTGTHWVVMAAPAVKAVAELTGTKPMVVYRLRPEPVLELSVGDAEVPVLPVEEIKVHASPKAATAARFRNVIIALVVIVGIIVLLVILGSLFGG